MPDLTCHYEVICRNPITVTAVETILCTKDRPHWLIVRDHNSGGRKGAPAIEKQNRYLVRVSVQNIKQSNKANRQSEQTKRTETSHRLSVRNRNIQYHLHWYELWRSSGFLIRIRRRVSSAVGAISQHIVRGTTVSTVAVWVSHTINDEVDCVAAFPEAVGVFATHFESCARVSLGMIRFVQRIYMGLTLRRSSESRVRGCSRIYVPIDMANNRNDRRLC